MTPSRLANLRDLGGLPLFSGGRTVPGVLYRSDAPYAGDHPPVGFDWPPAVVIDLRARDERGMSPYPWPASVRVVGHDLYDAARLERPADGSIHALYTAILAHAAPRIAAIPAYFPADGPTLIHCAAGKDRTGVSVAVLLLAAGVDESAVVADYLRTAAGMPGVVERLAASAGRDVSRIPPERLETPEPAIRTILAGIGSDADGAVGWLLARGADEARLSHFVRRLRGE
jgi:hypothetical protein